jgi:gluconate 2-dehydrogenase gamma chain
MIDRRDLIQRAGMLLGGAVSASAIAGLMSGCAVMPEPSGATKQTFLTAEELKTAAAIAEQIIPRTDTPGAIDVGVPGYIDRMLAGYYQDKERAVVRAGLAKADADAKAKSGKGFSELSPDDQVALIKVLDRQAFDQARRNAGQPDAVPHFFRILKELTITGFCTSQVGAAKFLKYTANPGPFKGDVPYSDIGKAWAT